MKNPKSEFKHYNKDEWESIIAKSLRNKSINDFIWQLTEDLTGESFAHNDDIPENLLPFQSNNKNNDWISGLDYSLITSDNHNEFLKLHTQFGLKSAIVNIPNSKINLEKLLKGINLDELDIIFNTRYGVDLILFLENLKDCLTKHHYNHKKIEITIRLPINNPEMLMELYQYSKINFPSLKLYLKTERSLSNDSTQYITESFNSLTEFINKSNIKKEVLEWLLSRLKVHFFLTSNFILNISTLRAFKIVWNNYVKAFRIKHIDSQIILGINHDSYTDEPNNNLIIATLLSMSGAITGVKSINIAPKESESSMNSMRLLLNIQNIMKHESKIDIVIDALAGSYAIEDATIKIAEQSWLGLEQ